MHAEIRKQGKMPNFFSMVLLIKELLWYQEVFKEVGCVTPFEGRNEKVCKEPEKGKKAYQVYQRSMLNTSVCMYPCQYHSTFTINKVEEPDMQPGSLWLGFRNFIQVHKANHIYTSLDLLASVGGYIGLFLGFSLLQIRDVLVLMIKKFLWYLFSISKAFHLSF